MRRRENTTEKQKKHNRDDREEERKYTKETKTMYIEDPTCRHHCPTLRISSSFEKKRREKERER